MTRSAHIISLPENTVGCDYVMGDIHGASTLFRNIISILTPSDRLFIVGDLFDRGENSLDIFHALMEMKRRRRWVYAVRGNHEDLFLKAHEFFRQKNRLLCSSAISFFRNGGVWIFKDPNLQCVAKIIGETSDESMLDQLIDAISNDPSVLVDEYDRIAAFLRTLPFIILVGNLSSVAEKRRAFFVCHADMPISDREVYFRIFENNDPFLSEKEQYYVMWAREYGGKIPIRTDHRTIYSVMAYVGHSIYAEKINSVRGLTNTVNLDAGAYCYGVSVVVNHRKNTVLFFRRSDCHVVEPYHAKRCNELLDFYFERRIKQYTTWSAMLENEFFEIKSFLLRQYDYYLFSQNNAGILSHLFFWQKAIDPQLLDVIQKMVAALQNATTKEGVGKIVSIAAGEVRGILRSNPADRFAFTLPVLENGSVRGLLLGCNKIFNLIDQCEFQERFSVQAVRSD